MCAFVRACVCVCLHSGQLPGATAFQITGRGRKGGWGGVGMEEVFGEGKKKKPRSPPGLRLAEARRPFTAQIFSSSQDCVG